MGDWRWLNDSTLVIDEGNRPVLLTAGEKYDIPCLLERGEYGVLQRFDPKGKTGRMIVLAPDMLDTLEKILDLEDPKSPTYSKTEKNMAELARRMILQIRGEG